MATVFHIKGRRRSRAGVGHGVRRIVLRLLCGLRLFRRRGRGSTMLYKLLVNSMVLPLLDLRDLLAWFVCLPFAMLLTLRTAEDTQ